MPVDPQLPVFPTDLAPRPGDDPIDPLAVDLENRVVPPLLAGIADLAPAIKNDVPRFRIVLGVGPGVDQNDVAAGKRFADFVPLPGGDEIEQDLTGWNVDCRHHGEREEEEQSSV